MTLGDLLSGESSRLGGTSRSGQAALGRSARGISVRRFGEARAARRRPPPQEILILPPQVLVHLGRRPASFRRRIWKRLLARKPRCLAFAGQEGLPGELARLARRQAVALLFSPHDPFLLESRLRGLLREKQARRVLVHGNLVCVHRRGVLLTGDAGVGKTSCALDLVSRGHAWVADDAVVVERRGDRLVGSGHPGTAHLLCREGRIRPVQKEIPPGQWTSSATVDLVVRLAPASRRSRRSDPAASLSATEILGVPIPLLGLPAAGGGQTAERWIACAVRHLLQGGEGHA